MKVTFTPAVKKSSTIGMEYLLIGTFFKYYDKWFLKTGSYEAKRLSDGVVFVSSQFFTWVVPLQPGESLTLTQE